MKELTKNEIIIGKITGISKYGIFLKINNKYDGLIHISEISNKYVHDIRKFYVKGEEIKAKIISIDEEKQQIKLSIKGIIENNKSLKILKEYGKGFEPLKENLNVWVEKKLNDINYNEKKL